MKRTLLIAIGLLIAGSTSSAAGAFVRLTSFPFGNVDDREVLERILIHHAEGEIDPDEAETALSVGGAASLGVRFQLLCEGVEVSLPGGQDDVDPGSIAFAAHAGREVLLRSIARVPATIVLSHLDELSTSFDGLAPWVASIEVIARAGSAEGFDVLFAAIDVLSSGGRIHPIHQRAITRALSTILLRDASSWRRLEERILRSDPEIYSLLASAVKETGDPRSLEMLEFFSEQDPRLSILVIEAWKSLGKDMPWEVEGAADVVARYLQDESFRVRQIALRALQELRATSEFDRVLKRLEDDDRRVQAAAQQVLESFSNSRKERDFDGWRDWKSHQDTWWETEGVALLDELEQGPSTRAIKALRGLCGRSYFRQDIIPSILYALDRREPALQAASCGALAHFGAVEAVPRLVDLLGSTDEVVRKSAWKALRELTGERLPQSEESWSEYVRDTAGYRAAKRTPSLQRP